MKTPIQELIEEYQRRREDGDNDMRTIIYLAEEMLEKEKETIIEAAAAHCYPTHEIALDSAKKYYNETFNTK